MLKAGTRKIIAIPVFFFFFSSVGGKLHSVINANLHLLKEMILCCFKLI